MEIRVLRIINRLVIGGPAYNVSYLSKYMNPEFKTILISGSKDEGEEDSDFIPKKMGIEPVYIQDMQKSLIKPWKDRKAYKELTKIIQDFKPHIVHTHAAKAGFIGRLAAIQNKVPIILHTFHGHYFHSYFHPVKTRILLQIERYLSSKTDGIIAISPEQHKELSMVYKVDKPSKVYEIPLGFDLDRFAVDKEDRREKFRNEFNLSRDTVAVGIIGRMVPIKNHSLYSRTIPFILKNTAKKVKFFYIGDGELRKEIEEELRRIQVNFTDEKEKDFSKPVVFTSWRKDMENVYAGMDIIALTSLNEGTPVSLIEAQAAEKCIVATDVGGVQFVVQQNKSAFLVPSNNLQAFKEKLYLLIEDKGLRDKMGKAGRNYVIDKFSYKQLVFNMSELYNRLLKSKGILPSR